MGTVSIVIGFFANSLASVERLRVFFAATEIKDFDCGRPLLSKGFDFNSGGDDAETLLDDPVIDDIEITGNDQDCLITNSSLLYDNGASYGTFNTESTVNQGTTAVPLPDSIALQVNKGHFAWDVDDAIVSLCNIDLMIPKGSLTMVIGLVGSGKSSVLSAILGEMTLISGTVQFNNLWNRISYCPQTAWLHNATIRENIVFGSAFDYKRYHSVLDVCALTPDLNLYAGGDMTEIGEKGINLSGGQKQRISVARAIYSKTDIIVMDDPLSALDVHVGKHLMEQAITGFVSNENRTVILVTHALQYLHHADQVIIMENGKIDKQGNLEEIEEGSDLCREWTGKIKLISDSETEGLSEEEMLHTDQRLLLDEDTEMPEKCMEKNQHRGAAASLIEEEDRERGSVSSRVYLAYGRAIGLRLVTIIMIVYALQCTALIMTNFWLSEWSDAGVDTMNQTKEEIEEQTQYYLNIYAALSFTYVGFVLLAISCQIIFSILAAKHLHKALLWNIFHAPMRFFDTTPTGRILNRFSSDTQMIDQKLWMTFNGLFQYSLQCISAIIVNIVVSPIFLVGIAPLVVLYYMILRYFVSTSRELQRLDNITRSPIYQHFSETLSGLSTIRAYRCEERFRRVLASVLHRHNVVQLFLHLSNRWVGVRLELVGSLFILVSGLGSLLSCVFLNLQPSLVGLALTQALLVSGCLFWTVRFTADCEMQMSAVERVEHYTEIETEQYQGVYNPPGDWPDRGDIQFENVSVRYADDLEAVLYNINIHFKSGQKIGICGRTGSGKSSLALTLLRMIDMYQGRIIIDGVDISSVPLLTLRSRLTIIPQDPTLFEGTIRFNLDPDYLKSDEELWEALEIAQLKISVSELDMQLDAQVSDGGENFSVGQRQLFCLARAFLRNSRIIIMDEVTASIDLKTDETLQYVITNAFADSTVLTIAHRISTIRNSDYIMVLSNGEVVEYDTPENLLKKDDGIFASLVKG
ncbi:ATP-binding cassette sub-family C member 8-like [Saccoglossus kowalevskii]